MTVVMLEPKELKDNNLRVLKLKKKENRRSLTRYFELLGYIFIIILYFKNVSFIRFVTRLILQRVLGNPFPTDQSMQLEQTVTRQLTKSFLYTILILNSIYLFLDLIVGVPSDFPDSTFFHGSLTLQIIGETKPTTSWGYVYYNAIIFACQSITLYLSTVLDTDADIEKQNVILPGSTYSLNEVEGDGYCGKTTVAHIHLWNTYTEITSYEMTDEYPEQYQDYMENRMSIGSIV